jgi:hypothetical protein
MAEDVSSERQEVAKYLKLISEKPKNEQLAKEDMPSSFVSAELLKRHFASQTKHEVIGNKAVLISTYIAENIQPNYHRQTVHMKPNDFNLVRNINDAFADKLVHLILQDTYRAQRQNHPTVFASMQIRTQHNNDNPASPIEGEAVSLFSSKNAVIFTEAPQSRDLTTLSTGEVIYTTLFENHKTKNCLCPILTPNNNIPILTPSLVCKPAYLSHEYRENPCEATQKERIELAAKQNWSPTNIFHGTINNTGLTTPCLIRRQSQAVLYRQKLSKYQPQFAQENMHENKELAAALNVQLQRSEFTRYTHSFTSLNKIQNNSDCRRYKPRKELPKESEAHTFPEVESVEQILNDTPTAQIYTEDITCIYCDQLLRKADLIDITNHILANHETVMSSNFSCPACLQPTIVDRTSFVQHWKTVHHDMLNLLSILNESHLGQRLQYGLAFYNALYIQNTFIKIPALQLQEKYILLNTAIYGNESKEVLHQTIVESQLQNLNIRESIRKITDTFTQAQNTQTEIPASQALPNDFRQFVQTPSQNFTLENEEYRNIGQETPYYHTNYLLHTDTSYKNPTEQQETTITDISQNTTTAKRKHSNVDGKDES